MGALAQRNLVSLWGLGRTILTGTLLSGLAMLIIPATPPLHWLAFPPLPAAIGLLFMGAPIYNITQVSLRRAVTAHRLLGGFPGTQSGYRNALWVTVARNFTVFIWIALSPALFRRSIPATAEDAAVELESGRDPE